MPHPIVPLHAVALAACLLAACSTAPPASSAPPASESDGLRGRTQPVSREPAPAPAEAVPPIFDRAVCVAWALRHSGRVRAAWAEWQAVRASVATVAALPEPMLTFGAYLEEVQTRTGPQEQRFGIRQRLPWPGRLDAQAEVARREAEAAWEQVEQVRLEVAADVEAAWLDYAFLAREAGVRGRLLTLLRDFEPIVQARVRAGASQEDLLRLQIEIGRLEDALTSVEAMRRSRFAALARAMSLRRWPDTLPDVQLAEASVVPVDATAAWEKARVRSPHLRALEYRQAARREEATVAALDRRPDFEVGLDWIRTGEAVMPTPGSGDDPVIFHVGVRLPLWGKAYDAADRRARHRIAAARARLEDGAIDLRSAIEEQAFRMEDAARQITLYRQTLLPRAEEALQLGLAAYRTGESSARDLIDSERTLLEFELALWRATLAWKQAEARLRSLVGEPRS